MTETMQAVQIHEYGGLDVLKLEAAPKPVPTENEVLIRVAAAGINPVDTYARAGGVAGMMGNDPFPLILGWDVSGMIEQASPSRAFKVGMPSIAWSISLVKAALTLSMSPPNSQILPTRRRPFRLQRLRQCRSSP